jgi:hypothetical protein
MCAFLFLRVSPLLLCAIAFLGCKWFEVPRLGPDDGLIRLPDKPTSTYRELPNFAGDYGIGAWVPSGFPGSGLAPYQTGITQEQLLSMSAVERNATGVSSTASSLDERDVQIGVYKGELLLSGAPIGGQHLLGVLAKHRDSILAVRDIKMSYRTISIGRTDAVAYHCDRFRRSGVPPEAHISGSYISELILLDEFVFEFDSSREIDFSLGASVNNPIQLEEVGAKIKSKRNKTRSYRYHFKGPRFVALNTGGEIRAADFGNCKATKTVVTPPPLPEPVPVPFAISGYGGWTCTGGDCDMHTSGSDRVPVRIGSTLRIVDGTSVEVFASFYCREYGGNRTTFSGTRVWTVYTAPHGRRILDINAKGGKVFAISDESIGRNHSRNPIPQDRLQNTYWRTLSWRIDSSSSNDSPYVGFSGTGEFHVQLDRQ